MRKKRNYSRHITPDVVYNSIDISKFINYMMSNGKKSIAAKIVYGSLDKAAAKLQMSQMEVFTKALKNASPTLHLVQKRFAFSSRSQAVVLNSHRSRMYGLRWIKESALKRAPYKTVDKLAAELIDACQSKGSAVKKNQAQYDLIVKSVVYVPSVKTNSSV